jgi:ABC-type lipoprotein export system ATPase subunit
MADDKQENEKVLSARKLTRHYRRGSETVKALSGVDLEIGPGRLVALVGPSGSGKTTLMNLIGLLDRPSSGEVWLQGKRVDNLPPGELVKLRRRAVGFIFQNFYLLPELPAWENVTLPMLFDRRAGRAERARELIEQVGLGERLDHLPSELSGGEMQRVAIARALANNPGLVLADEPTGKLDTQNGEAIAGLFRELTDSGVSILMATHDPALADKADEIVRLSDGSRV